MNTERETTSASGYSVYVGKVIVSKNIYKQRGRYVRFECPAGTSIRLSERRGPVRPVYSCIAGVFQETFPYNSLQNRIRTIHHNLSVASRNIFSLF
jgi:hypothetical protein